nr:MAG TPA: hypothetical protein [Caudoviricetes sp.]
MDNTEITLEGAQYIWNVLADIYGREHGVKLTVTVTPKENKNESTV